MAAGLADRQVNALGARENAAVSRDSNQRGRAGGGAFSANQRERAGRPAAGPDGEAERWRSQNAARTASSPPSTIAYSIGWLTSIFTRQMKWITARAPAR